MEHLIWILVEGRIPCLFHELTGFYCPGCGGTRAVLALLAGHPVLSFLYHPLVPYCALVALVFAVSYAIYWKTKDPRFRLYLSDAYVHVGLGIIVVNFLVKTICWPQRPSISWNSCRAGRQQEPVRMPGASPGLHRRQRLALLLQLLFQLFHELIDQSRIGRILYQAGKSHKVDELADP